MKKSRQKSVQRREEIAGSGGTPSSVAPLPLASLFMTTILISHLQIIPFTAPIITVVSAQEWPSFDSQEKDILYRVQYFLDGSNWFDPWTIDKDTDHCTYPGIVCDQDDQIVEIVLSNNNLVGSISSYIYTLPGLTTLNFSQNQITNGGWDGIDAILEEGALLSNIEVIDLGNNVLTSIDGIGKVATLKELHLPQNIIEFTIPEELYDLTSMEILDLSNNRISFTFSAQIEELTKLRELDVHGNAMTGTLPLDLFGNLVDLENLVLGQNKFTGTLPAEIGSLSNLREFDAQMNEIAGTIPTEIVFLSELTSLVLNGNSMVGTLVSELNAIAPLRKLHLQDQYLSGTVLAFEALQHLHDLDISANDISGSIPDNFMEAARQSEVITYPRIEIDLSSNEITGTIPAEFDDFVVLFLDLTDNRISGIPAVLCDDDDEFLDGLVGELTTNKCDAILCPPGTFSPVGRQDDVDSPCQPCPEATYFGTLECNSISVADSEILALRELYTATNGDLWDVKDNWMDYTKPICSWYGVTCTGGNIDNSSITEINLPDNNLDGIMTPLLFELQDLTTLNLKENGINMKFDNIRKAKKLEILYISDIDIGSIDGIEEAPALSELHLTANQLTGELPADFFDLADTMEYLYIAYNSFSGKLSTKFGNMKNLKDFYAYDNEFTGTLPTELASIPSLQNLVLAENKLSGTISEDFSYMPQLQLFSVYRRLKAGPKLTGPLPSFSNSPNLQGLYLDHNQLTGNIPSDFLQSSMNLRLVKINHNLLTGSVPTELLSFDALNIEMQENKITDFDARFCDKLLWMGGLVGFYGCDAFMCPPGYVSIYGLQNTTDSACQRCDASTDPTPYWGSTSCDSLIQQESSTFPATPINPTTAPFPTVSPAPSTNRKYCGVSQEDAQDRCDVTIPCPDGLDIVCLYGQACFPIMGPCDTDSSDDNIDAAPFAPVSPAPTGEAPSPSDSPTDAPTKGHVFDRNATNFCGIDYYDVVGNCHKKIVCPNGTKEECPRGQICFPEILNCNTPAPTMSMAPTNTVTDEVSTALPTLAPPTMDPTGTPTDMPTDSWEVGGSTNVSCMISLILQCFVMGRLIWMAFAM